MQQILARNFFFALYRHTLRGEQMEEEATFEACNGYVRETLARSIDPYFRHPDMILRHALVTGAISCGSWASIRLAAAENFPAGDMFAWLGGFLSGDLVNFFLAVHLPAGPWLMVSLSLEMVSYDVRCLCKMTSSDPWESAPPQCSIFNAYMSLVCTLTLNQSCRCLRDNFWM